jgi:hypothetical protein
VDLRLPGLHFQFERRRRDLAQTVSAIHLEKRHSPTAVPIVFSRLGGYAEYPQFSTLNIQEPYRSGTDLSNPVLAGRVLLSASFEAERYFSPILLGRLGTYADRDS